MALKSSREGLRKELVDYLGNIIVDDNLKNEIVKAVGDKFITPEILNENVNNLTMQITTESGERIDADDTLQNNITAEVTAREEGDTNLSDIKANKSDVLSLEEIQASTDLSGKIASASGLKTTFDAINLSIEVPYNLHGKDNIINNCKYISSLIYPFRPRMLVINNSGRGLVIGYTYDQREDTRYAQYFYYIVGHDKLFLINDYDGIWNVFEFSGVVL